MLFPDTKLDYTAMIELGGFYIPPARPRLWQALLCPWPIKMGEPTLSVMRFHKLACQLDTYNRCECPRYLAYLKRELKGERHASTH